MKKKKCAPKNLHTRFYIIAAVILMAGLGSAVLIYSTAGDDSDSALGYVMIDGQAYPVRHADSKIYRHDLELYGGKWNVVADDLMRWFGGLWHGKSLAFTIAGITIFIFLVFLFFAKHSPYGLNPDAGDKNDRAGTG